MREVDRWVHGANYRRFLGPEFFLNLKPNLSPPKMPLTPTVGQRYAQRHVGLLAHADSI